MKTDSPEFKWDRKRGLLLAQHGKRIRYFPISAFSDRLCQEIADCLNKYYPRYSDMLFNREMAEWAAASSDAAFPRRGRIRIP